MLEPETFHTRRRQQFLYDAAYTNVRSRLIEGIQSCVENVQRQADHPDPGYMRDAQGGLYDETFWLWMLEYPLSRLRCEAGQPCPQAGWWLTPAKANSRRHFKSGEIMPAFEGSSYGSTIWQWDIDQSAPNT